LPDEPFHPVVLSAALGLSGRIYHMFFSALKFYYSSFVYLFAQIKRQGIRLSEVTKRRGLAAATGDAPSGFRSTG
jgi:hypothetical protein